MAGPAPTTLIAYPCWVLDATQITRAQWFEAAIFAERSRELIERGLPGWRWTPARVLALITSREHLVIAARDDGGAAIGFAALQLGDTTAHLVLLAVDEAWQGQGVGRALLSWLERCCEEAGVGRITLEVRESAAGARAFYRRRGYSESKRHKGYYRGVEDAIGMTKALRDTERRVEWGEVEAALGWA